jgi:hypothetical protein
VSRTRQLKLSGKQDNSLRTEVVQKGESEGADDYVELESGVDYTLSKSDPSLKRKRPSLEEGRSLESLCYEELTAFVACEDLSLRFLLKLRNEIQNFLDDLNFKLELMGKRKSVMAENQNALRAVLKAKLEKDADDAKGVDRIVPARIKIGDFDEVVTYVGGYTPL